MKNQLKHYKNASYTALIFVILGYVVKFYPDQLAGFDSFVQTTMRGDLPAFATFFWSSITILGEAAPLFFIVFLIAAVFFFWKKWKAEAYFLVGSLVMMVGASTALKFLYQRPRPTIEWLVHTTGYSFPSWHAASTLLVAGVLAVVIYQRCQTKNSRFLLQGLVIGLAILVAISRIYVGVHYPTDILAGWLLALTILQVLYPSYDRIRFTWRFQSKQK